MKIIQNTSDVLVAKAIPWAFLFGFAVCAVLTVIGVATGLVTSDLTLLIVSLIFGGAVTFMFGLFGLHIVTVVLDRKQGTVIVMQAGLFKTPEKVFPLATMIEANTCESLNPRYLLHRAYRSVRAPPKLALIFATTDPPDIHIVPGWSDGESAMVAVANTINAWLSVDVETRLLRS